VLRFQWNSLRKGDRVLVHDLRDPGLRLRAGVVEMVQTLLGANDLGIRVGEPGMSTVLRPGRLAVHLVPLDASEPCWRCEAAHRDAHVAGLTGRLDG
jgi:hypothetical protein